MAALKDQRYRPALGLLAPKSRARARGRGADDGAGGAAPARRWCATAPRFNNCVEGAYGIARFAEREAVESDGHARSTCGVRELRDAPVRRSVRQWAAAARRPTSIVCWWRSFVGGERAMLGAPRIGAARRRRRATARQRATNTTLAATRQRERPTRHSPPHGDIDAADVAAAAAGRAARLSYGVLAKAWC